VYLHASDRRQVQYSSLIWMWHPSNTDLWACRLQSCMPSAMSRLCRLCSSVDRWSAGHTLWHGMHLAACELERNVSHADVFTVEVQPQSGASSPSDILMGPAFHREASPPAMQSSAQGICHSAHSTPASLLSSQPSPATVSRMRLPSALLRASPGITSPSRGISFNMKPSGASAQTPQFGSALQYFTPQAGPSPTSAAAATVYKTPAGTDPPVPKFNRLPNSASQEAEPSPNSALNVSPLTGLSPAAAGRLTPSRFLKCLVPAAAHAADGVHVTLENAVSNTSSDAAARDSKLPKAPKRHNEAPAAGGHSFQHQV
jgi:hypothetical protein